MWKLTLRAVQNSVIQAGPSHRPPLGLLPVFFKTNRETISYSILKRNAYAAYDYNFKPGTERIYEKSNIYFITFAH
jgi:hypothetical protein